MTQHAAQKKSSELDLSSVSLACHIGYLFPATRSTKNDPRYNHVVAVVVVPSDAAAGRGHLDGASNNHTWLVEFSIDPNAVHAVMDAVLGAECQDQETSSTPNNTGSGAGSHSSTEN
jgi:hypothetical protein